MSPLLEQARKLADHGIPIIPLRDKIPIFKYDDRRKIQASDEDIDLWFSNGDGRTPQANGIAIAINDSEFGIDTDGEKCESIFLDKIVTKLSPELQDKIRKTMHTKSPRGHHRTFRYVHEDFPAGIESRTFLRLNEGHNEIALIGKDHIFIERGPGYEIINDIESLVTLRKDQIEELLKALETVKAETNGVKTIAGILLPYYTNGRRDNLIFALCGYLHKSLVSESLISEIVMSLISQTNDEEYQARLRVVKDTCSKDPKSDQVSGYSRLLEALDNNQNALSDIQQVLNELSQGSFNDYVGRRNYQNDEIERILPSDILLELTPHIYKLISYNPLTFIVADQNRKEIIKSIIITPRKTRDNNNKSSTTKTTSTETTTTTTTITSQRYLPKNVIIDAIPTPNVVINDNPLDGNRTYQITFTHKASKKPFTLGPGTIKFIVEELQNKGRYVSKDAVEALSAILTKYEDDNKAEINNKIPYSGYYYVDGKIVGYDTTQRLDFDPLNNQEHKKEVLECIDVLDGLQTRNKKKTAFPTLLKWGLVSSFSFIIKTESKGVENALQGVHLYDKSDTGKSTLSIYAVLAVWRKHDDNKGKDNHLGPGSVDSEYRLGQAISRSTYPVLVDEVGALGEDKFYKIVEMIKYALLHRVARSGKFSEKRHSDILALSTLVLTSNPPPPRDPAFRRRFIIIQYTDSDRLTEGEKKEFKRWLIEEDRIDKLGALGDFAAKYIIEHPELVLDFKDSLWYKPGEVILREFYKSAGKEPPTWIELVAEQSAVQDSNEEKHFELVGFLRHTIQEAYRRDAMVEGRSGIEVDLKMKISDCLKRESIPFLYEHKRNKGEEVEVLITSNILSELKKYNRSLTNSSNYTLVALASEIPGFKVDQRKINGENKKVACGPRVKFDMFLIPTIKEMDE